MESVEESFNSIKLSRSKSRGEVATNGGEKKNTVLKRHSWTTASNEVKRRCKFVAMPQVLCSEEIWSFIESAKKAKLHKLYEGLSSSLKLRSKLDLVGTDHVRSSKHRLPIPSVSKQTRIGCMNSLPLLFSVLLSNSGD